MFREEMKRIVQNNTQRWELLSGHEREQELARRNTEGTGMTTNIDCPLPPRSLDNEEEGL